MLKVRGKGTVDADPTTTKNGFSIRVKVPASLRQKNDEGKYKTVTGTWFLNGWSSNTNPYTGKPLDTLVQYMKPGTQVDFEGSLIQVKKDDGTYSTSVNLISLDFANLPKQKDSDNNKPKSPVQAQAQQSPDSGDFREVQMDDLGMESIDLGIDMG